MRVRNEKWTFLFLFALAPFFSIARGDDVFYLELVINDQTTNQIAPVIYRAGDWEIASSDLLKSGIQLEEPVSERILLSSIKEITVTYDSQLQRLLLSVPSNMLPLQKFNSHTSPRNASARRDRGMFINYNLVSSFDDSFKDSSSLWHEVNFFDENYFLVSTGLAQGRDTFFSSSDYTRFETFYQRDNDETLQTFTLGDVINATPLWGRSVRIGGLRIARDYELNPSLITYPVPEFYGESALPGSAELIINDQLRWREQIISGPFMINTQPYISGAGVAQIVTTNTQGQQVLRSVNFYVANELLSPGMLDYDVTLGYRRQEFGLSSNEYTDKPVINTSWRYGLNRYITPQLLMQTGEGLQLGGAGLTFLAGSRGVFDLAASFSDYRNNHVVNQSGNQLSVSYSYTTQRFGINANILQRRGNYRDLGTLDNPSESGALNNRQMNLALSYQHGQLGGFNLGYLRTIDNQYNLHKFVSLSWSKYFSNDATAFININRSLVPRMEYSFGLTIAIPLGESSQASTSVQREPDTQWRTQIQAMQNAPYTGGFGWGFSADDSVRKNRYIAGNWRNQYSDITLSHFYSKLQNQTTATLNGALVLMANDIYVTRFIDDAFAVVEADKPDVPVMIGHELIGRTNTRGKLLVPELTGYLENHLSIDPVALPANATIDSIEKFVTPRRKGGILVKFPIRLAQSALATAVTENGNPLAAGTLLIDIENQQEYILGWDGEIYIENLVRPITLYSREERCVLRLEPPPDPTIALPRLGKFICKPVAEVNQ